MQTWIVHLRHPRRLWRDLGPRGFLAVNLIAGGHALTALAYPVLLVELGAVLVCSFTGQEVGFLSGRLMPLHLAAILAGYVGTIVVGLRGLAGRRQLRHAWIVLLAPLYWGLLSIAAWRALWQLLREPHRWEKTQHALSPRSKAIRSAQR